VAQVAAQCPDVSLLVNNAGVLKYSTFTGAPDMGAARQVEVLADERTRTVKAELSRDAAIPPAAAAAGTGCAEPASKR
jgi:short-subunit dehydrogenase